MCIRDSLSSIGTTTYVFGETPNRIIGSTVSGIGNTNLKWETVEDWNVGLDLALLQSRLKISVSDTAHSRTDDAVWSFTEYIGCCTDRDVYKRQLHT